MKSKEIINPPKGWYPGEMYEGNNICLRCAKYNAEYDHETTTKKDKEKVRKEQISKLNLKIMAFINGVLMVKSMKQIIFVL